MSEGWPGLGLPEDGLFLNVEGPGVGVGVRGAGRSTFCMADLMASTVQRQHSSWLPLEASSAK